MTDDAARPSVESVLAHARADFIAVATAALHRVDGLTPQLDAGEASDALEAIRQEYHRLQGSAGTFGFGRLTRQAAAAQLLLRHWRAEPPGGAPRAGLIAQVTAAMRAEISRGANTQAPPDRRIVLDGLDDRVATEVTLAATAAGLVVERAFAGELDDALADGAPLAVVTADQVASAGVEAVVAGLVARAGNG